MADLINAGSTWLASQLKAHVSSEVTYQRGQLSVTLNATLGNHESDVYSGEQGDQLVTIRHTDFIITPSDLVLGGSVVLPKAGDYIVHNGTTYRVNNLEGESCWRKSGVHGAMIRIHTKECVT